METRGRAMYDVLTKRTTCGEDTRTRILRSQGGDRQYHGMARTIADAKDNVDDRASTIVPPTATRPARKRRPPSQLQADPKMKTHAMRSS